MLKINSVDLQDVNAQKPMAFLCRVNKLCEEEIKKTISVTATTKYVGIHLIEVVETKISTM